MNLNDVEKIQKIGAKIKKLRIERGYGSYVAFAIEHELGKNYYWQVENGRNVTLLYLFKILNVHKISLQDFFEDIV